MIERELKKIISVDTYHKILSEVKWHEFKIQTNYYYATFPLTSNKMTVRVRCVNDQYLLQIKKSIPNSGIEKYEYEQYIDNIPALVSSEKIKAISGIDSPDTFLIGALTTERHICYLDNSITICLDKNYYLGICDYELELEYQDNIPVDIIKSCYEHNFLFDVKPKGKYLRYVNQYYNNIRTI